MSQRSLEQKSFRFNHDLFELPDIKLAEIAHITPQQFVKRFLRAQDALDQRPDFYNKGLIITAFLQLLKEAEQSGVLPHDASYHDTVIKVTIIPILYA